MRTRMIAATAALIAAAAALLSLSASTASAADPAAENCLAAHPGAVAVNQVTAGNDTVCVGPTDVRQASQGDDTYLWVGTSSADTSTVLTGDTVTDPGQDILSLADWRSAWTDTYDSNGFGGMFGVRVFIEVEQVTYTPFNDVIGDGSGCGRLTENNGLELRTIAGDDTVQCVAGQIYTGEGSDVVRGITLGTTVFTGADDDLAQGDPDGDVISLGTGNDVGRVVGGDVDQLNGGDGTDLAFASPNDDVTSAQVTSP